MRQEDKLKVALERLEHATRKTISTRSYCKDARSLKIIEEIIKEQLLNAPSHSSARRSR